MLDKTTFLSPATGERSALPFLVLVFGSTWLFQLPIILVRFGLRDGPAERYMPLAVLGFFGPFLIAIVLSFAEQGRAGARALFRPLAFWRVGVGWYVFALTLPCALFLMARAIWAPFAGPSPVPWFYPPSSQQLVAMTVIPTTELVPWLGFAFPRLHARHGTLRAIAVVALAWGTFHFQKHWFLDPSFSVGVGVVMIVYMAAGAIVFGWIKLRTGGSLLLPVLSLGSVYLNNPTAALPADRLPLVLHTAALVLAASGIVFGDRVAFRAKSSGLRAREIA
jgi:membrane protease YdiL (CAAX protease family)